MEAQPIEITESILKSLYIDKFFNGFKRENDILVANFKNGFVIRVPFKEFRRDDDSFHKDRIRLHLILQDRYEKLLAEQK